jgi:hypothetical protein
MTWTYKKLFERSQGTLRESPDSFNDKIKVTREAKEAAGKTFKMTRHVKFCFEPQCGCEIECTIQYLDNNVESCRKCRTSLTYEVVLERSQGTLTETKDSFNQKVKVAKEAKAADGKKFDMTHDVKFCFKPKCGCGEIECTIACLDNNIESCRKCRKENDPRRGQRLATINTERQSINIITNLYEGNQQDDILDCAFLIEGTDADLAFSQGDVRDVCDDAWIKIQCKSSTVESPLFDMKNNAYPDSIILLHDMRESPQFWLIHPSEYKRKTGIRIRSSDGIYAKYKINPQEIWPKIEEWYPNIKKYTQEELLTPKSAKAQLEHTYRLLREATLLDLTYESQVSYSVVDVKINGLKIQDKVRNATYGNNSFNFDLQKRVNGVYTNYDIDDNDLYELNLHGADIYYLIPQEELIEDGKIRSSITLYADHTKLTSWSVDLWTLKYQFKREAVENKTDYFRRMKILMSIHYSKLLIN